MNKVNTGYGSVEFISDKGFNINTEHEGLKRKHPLNYPETSEVEKMGHFTHLHSFMDEVLFERLYVQSVLFERMDEETTFSVFLINGKHRVGVVTCKGQMYPTLFAGDEFNSITINFEYSGEELDNFFSEIKKDIEDLISQGC